MLNFRFFIMEKIYRQVFTKKTRKTPLEEMSTYSPFFKLTSKQVSSFS